MDECTAHYFYSNISLFRGFLYGTRPSSGQPLKIACPFKKCTHFFFVHAILECFTQIFLEQKTSLLFHNTFILFAFVGKVYGLKRKLFSFMFLKSRMRIQTKMDAFSVEEVPPNYALRTLQAPSSINAESNQCGCHSGVPIPSGLLFRFQLVHRLPV